MRGFAGTLKLLLVAAAVSFGVGTALALPREVYLIRHAEKPDDDDVTHLSPKGYARAQALVHVFGRHNARFAVPDMIFAQSPDKASGSVRAIETVAPLAQSLNMESDKSFEVDEGKKLIKYLLDADECDGKVILIAWGRDELSEMAQKLGAQNFPDKFPKEAFDRVWRVEFTKDGDLTEDDLPMRALPGDSQD